MSTVASKTVNLSGGGTLNISLDDSYNVNEAQKYKRTPVFLAGVVTTEGVFVVKWSWALHNVSYTNGRAACFWNGESAVQVALCSESTYSSVSFDETMTEYNTTPPTQRTQTVAQIPGTVYGSGTHNLSFKTNVPVFDTEANAVAYINAATESAAVEIMEEHCLNFIPAGYEVDDSKKYVISTTLNSVDILYNDVSISEGSTESYRSTMFIANTPPALYFTGNGFELALLAPDVVAGYSVAGPLSTIEQVPESGYIQHSTGYAGNYYGNLNSYLSALKEYPGDGTYSNYATYYYSNIYIMPSRQAAEDAIASGDYTLAINFDAVISGNYGKLPSFGEDIDVSFGPGTFVSPFVSQYVMSASEVRDVSSIFFTDDQSLFEDIEKGLALYGAKPVDCIMSLMAFPFDVTDVVNTSPQYFVYFGSYKHDLQSPVNKIMNCLSNYLECGTIYLDSIFDNWRDFKHITLSVYLPFIGWRDLQIEKYIKAQVNVRYYVDINTRQCVAVLVVHKDGKTDMCDYFTGEIGIELPIVGTNFSEYARSEIQHIGNTVKSMLNPISPETLSNVSNAGDMLTNTPSKFDNYGMMKFGQNGSPKDMQMTKGSFSSGVGMYLPQDVIFRYDIHDVEEPALLSQMAGKPSTASGKIGNFSGYLSGRVTKLNTTGMTDSEIQEVMNGLINEGIYV